MEALELGECKLSGDHSKTSIITSRVKCMNTISEEELLALQAHVEVENCQWRKLKKRILIRTGVIIVLLLSRVIMFKVYPQTLVPIVFESAGLDAEGLSSLISARLVAGIVLAGVYFYAVMTNSYLRSVTVIALMVPIALIWADLQMYLASSFPDFTLVASISFCLRLITISLLTLNYMDVRR